MMKLVLAAALALGANAGCDSLNCFDGAGLEAKYDEGVERAAVVNGEHFAQGKAAGLALTHTDGERDGERDGYDAGFSAGYHGAEGYAAGYADAYDDGATEGSFDPNACAAGGADGYAAGSSDGYGDAYSDGHADGYSSGYAAGGSDGAAACDAPWLAFLNPDCFLPPDALVRLRALAQAAGGALVGADLVDADGRRDPAARRRDPDFAAMLRDVRRARLAIAPDPAQALQPVPAISGALMLLPRAAFARLGAFDPGYRLHVEDLDLCRRARLAGIQVACANDVQVVHLRGVSSRGRRLFVEWHKHRGLWRYFRRFEAGVRPRWQRAAVALAIWLHFPLALLRRG